MRAPQLLGASSCNKCLLSVAIVWATCAWSICRKVTGVVRCCLSGHGVDAIQGH